MDEGAPVKVKEWMSRKLLAVSKTDTIGQLLEKMEELRFRHLPVVDGDKLVGLLTQRDLLHASSSFLSDQRTRRDELIGTVKVGDIMQSEIITAKPDDRLAEVGHLMLEGKIGCVPVIEDDGKLVGLLTDTDFIRLSLWYLADSPASS